MARVVAMAPIGAALALGVWRDNEEQTIPVTVAEWRGNQEQAAVQPVPRPPPPDLGLQLSPITDAFRELYRLPADRQGVLVTGVMPLSPADDRGLRVGDLILSVQMVQVKAPADVTQQFERMRQQGKQYALVLTWGNNATKSIALPLSSGSSSTGTGRSLLSQCGDEPPRATLRVHVLRERRVLVDDTQDLLATEIRHLQKRALNAGLSILAENCRVCWSTKYGDR